MQFLKDTFTGGFLLVLPISACILILAKVHKVMVRLMAPLADWLPIDTMGGAVVARVVAVVGIVGICFAAGLIARSRLASRLVERLESGVLHSIPGYTFIKGLTGGLDGGDDESRLAPVLARFDDVSQIGFHVEDLADGRVVLYLPGAPDPWSGSLVVMEGERVQPLDHTLAAAVRHLRALGRGSGAMLPPEA